MSASNAMSNLGDLTKPATVLIEKISDAGTAALVAAWSKLVVQNVQNLCSRGMAYASNSLPFGFRSRLIFTAAAVDGWFLVRNILAAL
jgi:hypothetical protein